MENSGMHENIMLYSESMGDGSQGEIFDYPGMEGAFRSGHRFVEVCEDELIPLPYGSYMFTLPGRVPVTRRGGGFEAVTESPDGNSVNAVAAFLASAYLRTKLPAYKMEDGAVTLPLWAYSGVVLKNDEFYVPAFRVDDDPRSDPHLHEDRKGFHRGLKNTMEKYPENRLVEQLSICSTEYNCLCARNFFMGRYECPVPTSPACNADCVGCLSFQQEESGFRESQFRLEFSPDVNEITEVILHHFSYVDYGVASFGQGCEGEPLLRGRDLVSSVARVREKTDRGTVNLNTNGSRPDIVKELIGSGLDSIRISMNSPTEKYYNSYYRPVNYSYSDVLRSIETALNSGIFVSINLFFMPGFTDAVSEFENLFRFLEKFPVSMIQTRNLNIDPDYYFSRIGFEDEDAIGVASLVNKLRLGYPDMRIGYYNPPLRK